MHLNKGLLTSVVVSCIAIYSQYNLHLGSTESLQAQLLAPKIRGRYGTIAAMPSAARPGGVRSGFCQHGHPFPGHRVLHYQHNRLHILQLGSQRCSSPISCPAPSVDITTCSIIPKLGTAKTRQVKVSAVRVSGYLTPKQLNPFPTQE